jgi:peptide-methionine (S)-S-oxide reductase
MFMAKATFAAGCYWGVEAEFRRLPGVTATRVGFIGGASAAPSYRDVCSGGTGHAEAVEVEFDPEAVTYDQLLEQFWDIHNPTTPDRQGWDVGDQYRSAIFTHSEEQEAQARASFAEQDASGRFRDPIVTEIVAASAFTPAHEDHQRYLEKRGMVPKSMLSAAG